MILLAAITLALAPWRGPSLPTATSDAAAKYKLTVQGPAEDRVRLQATGLPSGWVASFCTKTTCSPFNYTMELNDRGIGTIEFQAIRTGDSAPKHVRLTISTEGAKPLNLHI